MKSVVRLYRTVLLTWLKYDNISVLCSQAVHPAVRRDNRTSVEKKGEWDGNADGIENKKTRVQNTRSMGINVKENSNEERTIQRH